MLAGFSAAVIWERSQLSTKGEEIGRFNVNDWSFGTFPGKQRPVTNLEPGNLVSTAWKKGSEGGFPKKRNI